MPSPYFNTSHVNVNHTSNCLLSIASDISIHLMLMLIGVYYTIKRHKAYFMLMLIGIGLTIIGLIIPISIHLMLMLID